MSVISQELPLQSYFLDPILVLKGEHRNRAKTQPKIIKFQIDRSQRLFVQNTSELVRFKALDVYFQFLHLTSTLRTSPIIHEHLLVNFHKNCILIIFVLVARTSAHRCSQSARRCSQIWKMKSVYHKLSNAPTPKYFRQKVIENEHFEIWAFFVFSQNMRKS